jgi:hypothetical protein
VGLWREWTGHEYGEQEPLIRAALLDYVLVHEGERSGEAHRR